MAKYKIIDGVGIIPEGLGKFGSVSSSVSGLVFR